MIVYAPDPNSHPLLMGVSAEGGTPRALTRLGTSELNHRWPQLLPGGRAVLLTAELAGKPFDDALIVAQDLETGERNVVVEAGSHGRYVSTGHIVYGRGNALHAVPFDLKRRRATGPSQVVLEGVRVDTPTGCFQFDVSVSGTLVYLPRGGRTAERALVWVDRFGNAAPVTEAGGLYNIARLSPDGRRIAAEVAAAENDIWMIDLATGSHTRLTFESENNLPLWMPDGRSILFSSTRGGVSRNLYRLSLDGSAAVQRLTESPNRQWPEAISPDGRLLLFTESKPDGDTDLAVLSLAGKPEVRPLIQTGFIEKHAELSPDGHHLAYASNESGSFEVYVQAFPSLGAKVRVSIEGGAAPIWSRDGREIYFRNGDKAMAVSVSSPGAFSVSRPKQLFEGRYGASWDVGSDGRFLMIRLSEEETSSRQINVVLNWTEELKRRFQVSQAR